MAVPLLPKADIILLFIKKDHGIEFIKNEHIIKERDILKIFGSISLGDRYSGHISYQDDHLKIGKDLGRFNHAKKDRFIEIP